MKSKLVPMLVVEMRRALHRRLVRWMITLALALCALSGVLIYLSSRDPAELARSTDHPAHMAAWWATGGAGGDSLLLTAALFLVIGAAICGASVAGAEWRAGTITTTLTWEPSRLRLHAARTASAGFLAFVIGFALQVALLTSALPAALLNGTTEGTDTAWWIGLAAAIARSRSSPHSSPSSPSASPPSSHTSAALIAMAAWALVIERTIATLRPGLARFMIGENVATVVPWTPLTDVEFNRPPAAALASLLAYLAVIAPCHRILRPKRHHRHLTSEPDSARLPAFPEAAVRHSPLGCPDTPRMVRFARMGCVG